MSNLDKKTINTCKERLLEKKMELLNTLKQNRLKLAGAADDQGGDEADQSVRILSESDTLISQERARQLLYEIEFALSKIENGSYGVCEETEELIEVERLIAIPWTRLSIEGAEIREAIDKRFAR